MYSYLQGIESETLSQDGNGSVSLRAHNEIDLKGKDNDFSVIEVECVEFKCKLLFFCSSINYYSLCDCQKCIEQIYNAIVKLLIRYICPLRSYSSSDSP